jgi:predicted Holliday junction resolvase-like endonuclease
LKKTISFLILIIFLSGLIVYKQKAINNDLKSQLQTKELMLQMQERNMLEIVEWAENEKKLVKNNTVKIVTKAKDVAKSGQNWEFSY